MCDSCSWEDLLSEIEDLCADERYDFAADTLTVTYDWIEEEQHCTEKQRQAVENIQGSVEK